MSSSRSHGKRPEDVTLPPISQIFNVASSSDASLPPLRASHESHHPHHHASHQSGSRTGGVNRFGSADVASGSDPSSPPFRAGHEGHHYHHHHTIQQSGSRTTGSYGAPVASYSPEAPDLRDAQMKRPRYDPSMSNRAYMQPQPPATSSSVHRTNNPYGDHPSHLRPSGMAIPEESTVMHGRTENRYAGAPPPGYGPSPYSYIPPPPRHAQSSGSSYATSSGPSHVSYPGESHSGSSRSHGYPSTAAIEQGNHPEEPARSAKYECSYCGKGFLRPSALKIHIISHTGDKDYVCPEESCGRRFGVRSNMLRHIRLVHQGNHSHSSGEDFSNNEWSE